MINSNDDNKDNKISQQASLINQNEGDGNTKRHYNDKHESNVHPLKPNFERSNLNADQEKRAGSGGSSETMKGGQTNQGGNN